MPPRNVVLRRTARAAVAALIVLLACGAAGCMRTSVRRIARYAPGADPVQRRAPAGWVYKVKYADVAGGEMKTARGSARVVERGAPLGFCTAADGTLLAVAGDEIFPLDAPAERVRFCVWYTRRKEPRQFVKEVGRVAESTAGAVGYVAGKALEAGVNAALNADGDDDDDCDDDAGPWNWGGGGHDHHSHHHGGGGGNHDASGGGNPKPKPGGGGSDKPQRIGVRNP
jgi:hypothetical protein